MKLAPISSTMINNICLGIMVLGLLLFVYESRLLTVHIDDAYISYQYAKNLAAGNGLVFNVGENVEGITNLLWTTIIAGGIYLGWSAETVSHTLGMSSGLALLLASFWYARRCYPELIASWPISHHCSSTHPIRLLPGSTPGWKPAFSPPVSSPR